MKAPFLLLTAVLAAGISCSRTALEWQEKVPNGFRVSFSLERSNPPSRSSFCPDELDAITDLNVWVYQEGVLLPAYSFHTNTASSAQVSITFPSVHASYDIYFLANLGEVEGPELEVNISTVTASVDNYSSFRERGFPMAGAVLAYSPSVSGSVSLSRLVGRFDITAYDNPANTRISYTFLSGKMKACAKAIRPFGTLQDEERYASRAEAASEVIAKGDSLSAADIATLNAGGTVSLYYLENCQGQLLPANDTQHGKNAAAIAQATGDQTLADLCSYLELTCRAETPTATYSSVVYRAYLGRDATGDFSVVRNTVNPLRLDMASDLIVPEDWFVEPSDPSITGTLCFADTRYTSFTCPSAYQTSLDANEYRRPFRKVSSIYLMKGFAALYYIYLYPLAVLGPTNRAFPRKSRAIGVDREENTVLNRPHGKRVYAVLPRLLPLPAARVATRALHIEYPGNEMVKRIAPDDNNVVARRGTHRSVKIQHDFGGCACVILPFHV